MPGQLTKTSLVPTKKCAFLRVQSSFLLLPPVSIFLSVRVILPLTPLTVFLPSLPPPPTLQFQFSSTNQQRPHQWQSAFPSPRSFYLFTLSSSSNPKCGNWKILLNVAKTPNLPTYFSTAESSNPLLARSALFRGITGVTGAKWVLALESVRSSNSRESNLVRRETYRW